MAEPFDLTVRAGECPCPGTPHLEEHVYLEPTLTLPMAAGAYTAISNSDGTLSGYESALVEAYIPRAILRWTFVERSMDGKGTEPVPITRENVERLLPWDQGGLELADAADSLYSARLMRPLVARLSMRSLPTSTDDSTSANQPSGGHSRKQSKRSLRNGSDGKPSAVPDR